VLIGPAIPAGFPDASGVYHATITYQGLTDGTSHSYTFTSIGLDGSGLVQAAAVNPVTFTNQSFTASSLQVTGLTVENGAAERSYIRYLDVDFSESDAQSGGQLTTIAGSVGTALHLYQYDLNGDASSKTAVPLSGVTTTVIDHAIELDFGAAGLGGNANTTAADGYYELDVIEGGTTYKHFFYRLLGDVTGDGVVDNNDLNAIATELTLSAPTGYSPLSADVNGDGSVTAMDTTLATRAKGHKLGSGLPLG
jgi:Dockerin type I domain